MAISLGRGTVPNISVERAPLLSKSNQVRGWRWCNPNYGGDTLFRHSRKHLRRNFVVYGDRVRERESTLWKGEPNYSARSFTDHTLRMLPWVAILQVGLSVSAETQSTEQIWFNEKQQLHNTRILYILRNEYQRDLKAHDDIQIFNVWSCGLGLRVEIFSYVSVIYVNLWNFNAMNPKLGLFDLFSETNLGLINFVTFLQL